MYICSVPSVFFWGGGSVANWLHSSDDDIQNDPVMTDKIVLYLRHLIISRRPLLQLVLRTADEVRASDTYPRAH